MYEGYRNIRRVSEIYEGYRKIKKPISWVSIEYRKYPEGIENIRRVSEILGGYRKFTKGIRKLKN